MQDDHTPRRPGGQPCNTNARRYGAFGRGPIDYAALSAAATAAIQSRDPAAILRLARPVRAAGNHHAAARMRRAARDLATGHRPRPPPRPPAPPSRPPIDTPPP